ncbi:MAG TPA: galactokinase [Thermomicrobiales bacterium]|jgi:galactokinase
MADIEQARLQMLVGAHRQTFGQLPTIVAQAPGRVNLIGEHTDYNDGFVLPAAIDRDVVLVATPRPDRRLRIQSLNAEGLADLDLDELEANDAWHDYAAGVADALQRGGYRLFGLDATVAGTVPLGGGLSSSAALEVATAFALALASDLSITEREIALLCQKAENDFVGAKVGVMDQFVSVFGQPDHAIFLDCRTLETRPIPLPLQANDLALVVCDSGVKHALAGGEYNRRRQECAGAVTILKGKYPEIDNLRDVTSSMLRAAVDRFGADDQTLLRRARHVVSENARVEQTIAALRRNDWSAVGSALWASHASLRDDYEVSVPEINALVEIARGVRGVLGARLMGGGFGGSTLTLVRRDAIDAFTAAVAAEYPQQTGQEATVYPVEIVGGARVGWVELSDNEAG